MNPSNSLIRKHGSMDWFKWMKVKTLMSLKWIAQVLLAKWLHWILLKIHKVKSYLNLYHMVHLVEESIHHYHILVPLDNPDLTDIWFCMFYQYTGFQGHNQHVLDISWADRSRSHTDFQKCSHYHLYKVWNICHFCIYRQIHNPDLSHIVLLNFKHIHSSTKLVNFC